MGACRRGARHEQGIAPAPDAVSFLLDIGGVRIWDVGDNEYDARTLECGAIETFTAGERPAAYHGVASVG